jgi:metal-responsive CopG/Arc/MetJ family transcriptional regulator
MGEPVPDTLTPAQVGRFLMGLARRLDELVAEFKQLGEQVAVTKRNAAVAQARAFIESGAEKRTVPERQAYATVAAADAQFEADLAKAQHDACREAIRALHARLDVGRTLSATSREEMRMAGGPQ